MTTRTDPQIHKAVVDELAFEPSLNAGKVAVAVEGGIVTLTGSVPTYTQKSAAEHAVKRVWGVKGLAEELTVHPLPSPDTDTDLAGAARRALQWDAVVADDTIQIKVERGWVELSGQLHWHFERVSAEQAVAKLRGVVGVTNLITLMPHAGASDVLSTIEAAFRRGQDDAMAHVALQVEGGSVTLRGSLPSWDDIDAASLRVWSVPGVTAVDNRIMLA